MSQVKFSIITINYNNKEGLRKTIESVINQSFKDFEYIIIDGGSTDGSIDVIKEYASYIDYWVSEPDKGIYNAMNKGIVQAHGEYLNFMNSGDCFYDGNILDMVKLSLNADIVAGKLYVEGKGVCGIYKDDITLLDLFLNVLPHQSSFIKRELFEDKLYDEKYTIVSDWKFFVESLIFRNCTFANLDVIVCKFEPGGISSNNDLHEKEGVILHEELFPKRIFEDYVRLINVQSPMLDLIPQFNHTDRFQQLICSIVSFLISLRKVVIKIWR